MQFYDLNFKPHGGKILWDIINHVIGVRFYPTPVSGYYKLLCLDRFHGSTQINDKYSNNDDTKFT